MLDDEAPGDPLLMLDELPDLQNAASSLMNMLVTNQSDPINIVNEARRMRTADPRSLESRRLKSLCRKLFERMKQFSSHTFIDVHHIRELIPSIHAKDGVGPWSPSPALHSANCARLAFELLLSTADSQSARQVVRTLNDQFPAPFLNRLTSDASIGSSGAEKAAFDLAVEIRTQYFISEFERLQNQKDFDPNSLLQSVFYDGSQHEGNDLDSRWLRGFALESSFQDENKCLPERFHDTVLDRISELKLEMFDDNDAPNVGGLKTGFPWKRFSVRVVRFLHTRDREIRRDLKAQAKFDEVQDLLVRIINGEEAASVEPSVPVDSPLWSPSPLRVLSTQGSLARQSPNAGRIQQVQDTPVPQASVTIEIPRPRSLPRSSIEQHTPVSQGKQPATKDPHRRKSAKGFLNMQNITRLKQRMDGSVPASSRQTSRVPEGESTVNEETNTSDRDIGDETTLHHDVNDDFDLTGLLDESTTPPGSARTNQISHSGQWLDSPRISHDRPNRRPLTIQAQQTPPRTYFDRQNNASRVSPINDDTQSAERPSAQPNNLNSKKRSRQEADDETESVDEFEQDTRVTNVQQKRAAKPHSTRRVRPRQETDDDSMDAGQQLQDQLMASSHIVPETQSQPSAPAPTRQTQPAPTRPAESPPRPTQPLVQSSWASRNAPGAETSRPHTVRRKGGKWSKEEDERLIQLIAAHGTSWKDILQEDKLCPESDGGPVFTMRQRSGVDIKDRARVLKRHYEK